QAERLEVHRGQYEEAPHGEEVCDAGDGPAQQPGLPEDLFELRGDALLEVVFAVVALAHGLAGPDQRGQPQDAFDGEDADDGDHQDPDDDPDQHLRIHAGLRISCYPWVTNSMLLASNFSSVPAHSYIRPGNAATKADLTRGRVGQV